MEAPTEVATTQFVIPQHPEELEERVEGQYCVDVQTRITLGDVEDLDMVAIL